MTGTFHALTPGAFEEFCKDVLHLDGFGSLVLHGKGQDGGIDLTATKNVAVAHGQQQPISWLIQCKHTTSGKSLSLSTMDAILANFQNQYDFQGLAIITSGKFSPRAAARFHEFTRKRNPLAFCWDSSDLRRFLSRHPFLIDKYGLEVPSHALPGASAIRALVLGDGSVFAYHGYNVLRTFGFRVAETRLHQYGAHMLTTAPEAIEKDFDIVLVFLGELFGFHIPLDVVGGLYKSVRKGLRAVFTPFCAWSVGAAVNPELGALLPVKVKTGSVDVLQLAVPTQPHGIRGTDIGLWEYKDTFIENQLVDIEASVGPVFSTDLEYHGRSSYEFLDPNPGSKTVMEDSQGNPLVVTQPLGKGVVAYFNMCAHNCMTPFPLKSPLEGSEGLRQMFAEFVLWFARQKGDG